MLFVYALIMAALLFSAHKATRVKGLLNAALWLAATSCLTSILIYLMGSPGLAVIELSVGAGLVTVLFVFAISIIGDESITTELFVPKWLAITISIVSFGLLAYLSIIQPLPQIVPRQAELLAETIWVDRKIDIYVQGALMVAGILGILMLIAPSVSEKMKERRKG